MTDLNLMNSDGINRINFLRSMYQAKEAGNSSEVVRELQKVKNELKIANDERAREQTEVTNATNSPYLTDQIFFKKDVIFNSEKETQWKEVKSAEQVQSDMEEAYIQAELNKKKLNVLF